MTDSVRVAAELAMRYAVKISENPDDLAGNFTVALKKVSFKLDEIETALSELENKIKE